MIRLVVKNNFRLKLPPRKLWTIVACAAVLIVVSVLLLSINGIIPFVEKLISPDLIENNRSLESENIRLTKEIADLKKHNRYLKKSLDAQEHVFLQVKEIAENCGLMETVFPNDLPEELTKENYVLRHIFHVLLEEKKRWDMYLQQQYRGILDDTLEPLVIETQNLFFENEESIKHFLKLESTLNLHKRLIRDVRLFHDEVRYQNDQMNQEKSYELYDLKFQLNPFARASGLADGLQQAMSALGAGIYQQEAADVLERLGDEFTKPLSQLVEWKAENVETPTPDNYNYHIYAVFAKKLVNYSDNLAQQSLIHLAPSAIGELDHFSRRLSECLYDLDESGVLSD